jgi:2-oxoacid dehydrogenases acyltransferase (catalytic domain)
MFGRHGGWALAPNGHTLDLLVGGIACKPAFVEGRIEPRDMLKLTIAFDHDVVDGAPAARFVERLKRPCRERFRPARHNGSGPDGVTLLRQGGVSEAQPRRSGSAHAIMSLLRCCGRPLPGPFLTG